MQYEKDFFDVLERIAKSLEKINQNFEKYIEFKQIEDNDFDPETYQCYKCGKTCNTDNTRISAQAINVCNACYP